MSTDNHLPCITATGFHLIETICFVRKRSVFNSRASNAKWSYFTNLNCKPLWNPFPPITTALTLRWSLHHGSFRVSNGTSIHRAPPRNMDCIRSDGLHQIETLWPPLGSIFADARCSMGCQNCLETPWVIGFLCLKVS